MHIVKSFKIDPKLPIRGVPFESIRDLLHHVYPLTPVRYTDALNLVINKGIILSQRGGKLKKSSFYHYWTALQQLGFIEQSGPLRRYTMTQRGNKLVDASSLKSNILTDLEKEIFREGILANKHIWENFLFLFTGQNVPNIRPPVGNRVLFIPAGRKSYILESPFVKEKIHLDASKSLAVIFGLRRWGQQCDLLDEIFLPTTEKTSPVGTSFMYLVDPSKNECLTIDVFTKFVSKYQSKATVLMGSTLKFNISKLLTELCVQEGISLIKAQEILTKWLEKHKYEATVERPSKGLIEEQRGPRHQATVIRNQPWLFKNDHVYTTLFVQKEILGSGG